MKASKLYHATARYEKSLKKKHFRRGQKCVETYSPSNAAPLNLGKEVQNKHEHTFQNKKITKAINEGHMTIPKLLYRQNINF